MATTVFYANSRKQAPTDYASWYLHENVTAFTIEEANTAHAVHGATQNGMASGWSFYAGKALAITKWETSDGGTKTKCSQVAHGLANGDIVTFANTTNYDGIYVIEQKADDSFVIPKAYVADNGAQVGHAAAYLTCSVAASAGQYMAGYFFTITPATNNEVFEFEIYSGTTEQTQTESQTKLGTAADYQTVSALNPLTYVAGNKIWVKTENKTGTGD